MGSPCNGRDARCPSGFAQANGFVRKPTLPPSWVSWASWVSWFARQKMKSLAGGPPTPSGAHETESPNLPVAKAIIQALRGDSGN